MSPTPQTWRVVLADRVDTVIAERVMTVDGEIRFMNGHHIVKSYSVGEVVGYHLVPVAARPPSELENHQ